MTRRNFAVYDIEWDGDEGDELPTQTSVVLWLEADDDDFSDNNDIAEALCETLTQEFGFFVSDFKWGSVGDEGAS